MTYKPLCYALWVIPIAQGVQEMRAICTERIIANRMRKMLLDEDTDRGMILRCWVEPLEMNHCFGASMLEMVDTNVAKVLIERGIDFKDRPDPKSITE